jgi:poly(hydroxyalkanoate) depolymerase family esterase
MLRRAARLAAALAHEVAATLPAPLSPQPRVPQDRASQDGAPQARLPETRAPDSPAPASLPPRSGSAPSPAEPALPAPAPGAPHRSWPEPGWQRVEAFGDNPGQLRMLWHVPRQRQGPPPLVVLLHGCGQDAPAFAEQSGWAALSDARGFVLLLPEQTSANNHGRCFNWFQPRQTRRGAGEADSVRAMVDHATRRLGCDPRRVFVAGLSAGGAMAACLLAAYPERFAAGAAIAGLPVGCAEGSGQAMLRMMQAGPARSAAEWASAARACAPAQVAAWPRLSVWQGGADHTVNPANADALAAQFAGLHGLHAAPDEESSPDTGLRRRVWRDAAGSAAIEHWSLARMGHGYPVRDGREQNWVLPVGVQATEEIARFWGI